MSKPVPGKKYTVVTGDYLGKIAQKAYGEFIKWRIIWQANQTTLKSDDPDLIFPGEIIIIPGVAENEPQERKEKSAKLKIGNKTKEQFTLLLDGIEVPVQSSKIIRTMDTAADGWTAKVARDLESDKRLEQLIRPYSYTKASVYLGSNLMIDGALYVTSPILETSGISADLEGFSSTADIIDSTLKPPYEKNKVTLEQYAKSALAPFGIDAIFETSSGGKFDRITANQTDTVFSVLARYASQRGLLISSTPSGDLLFLKANTKSKPVATIEEGKTLAAGYSATYDGRLRFNVYKAVGQSPGSNKNTIVAKDDQVSRSRFLTFTANDSTSGNIKNAAEWKRSKQIAESMAMSFPVRDWYTPDGEMWKENTLITLKSKALFIPDGFDFLVKSVEYSYGLDGRSSVLNLVPPQVYTGEPVPEPWKDI